MAIELKNLNINYDEHIQNINTKIPTYSIDYSTLIGSGVEHGFNSSLVGVVNCDNMEFIQIMENPEIAPIYWEAVRGEKGFRGNFCKVDLVSFLREPQKQVYDSIVKSFESMKTEYSRIDPLANKLLRKLRTASPMREPEGTGIISFRESLD